MINWFVFGRTPELSWGELQAVSPRLFPGILTRPHKFLARLDGIVSREAFARLGGVIRVVCEVEHVASTAMIEELVRKVIKQSSCHLVGFSSLGSEIPLSEMAGRIKRSLLPIQHIEYKIASNGFLNAFMASEIIRKGLEFVIFKVGSNFVVTTTLYVQDSREWSKRDYDRPAVDPKAGMLPPKLARIMVNLAVRERDPKVLTVLDPFCGSGTILAEALLLGCKVIGVDQNAESLENATRNIIWLAENYPSIRNNYLLISADATKLNEKAIEASVVVTEPYLGPSRIRFYSVGKVKRILDGLRRLYIGFLRSLAAGLDCDGYVVLVTPEIVLPSGKCSSFSLIDICEKLGYSVIQGPYEYSRPKAIVRRQVWVIQKMKGD